MTDQEIRIAIAEKCGWTKDQKGFWFKPGKNHSWNYDSIGPTGRPDDNFPNYPNDLNAMHEAEQSLTPNQSLDYLASLTKQISCENCFEVENRFRIVTATARQRAEAFLRTLGLWKE